jgi:hypothetical protein
MYAIFQYIITNSDLQNVFLKAKTQKAILCELTDMRLKRNNFFDCKILERYLATYLPLKNKKAALLIEQYIHISRCPKNGVLTVHYGVEGITVNARKMLKKFYWTYLLI